MLRCNGLFSVACWIIGGSIAGLTAFFYPITNVSIYCNETQLRPADVKPLYRRTIYLTIPIGFASLLFTSELYLKEAIDWASLKPRLYLSHLLRPHRLPRPPQVAEVDCGGGGQPGRPRALPGLEAALEPRPGHRRLRRRLRHPQSGGPHGPDHVRGPCRGGRGRTVAREAVFD